MSNYRIYDLNGKPAIEFEIDSIQYRMTLAELQQANNPKFQEFIEALEVYRKVSIRELFS